MITDPEFRVDTVLEIAKRMAIAARTAPKGRGKDNIEIKIASGNDLFVIADKMDSIGENTEQAFFLRDAGNIRNSTAVLLVGTGIKPLGLTVCGLCGLKSCENKEKYPDVPCAFNTHDLGIAVGSAAGVAMDNRVDNRIMYSVGMAVRDLKIFPEDIRIIIGIALSATSKNIFFDRK